MVWPRCSECGRLTIGVTDIMVAPLKPHMTLLLRAAREFDESTPPGEHFSAIEFVDTLALSVAHDQKYLKRGGSPGRARPSKVA